jgi:hypothetical protein
MSTAEVERVFSQVKLVKCDHINRMKQVTMNNILQLGQFIQQINLDIILSFCH